MKYAYKVIIAYDGTDFYGWQLQPGVRRTVIGELQKVFKRVFGFSVLIIGASRTDAGVHAYGQVAVFKTDLLIDPQRMLYALNASLSSASPDIQILYVEVADITFHPIYTVAQKEYWYDLVLTKPTPFNVRYVGYCGDLDIELVRAALRLFEGTYDFRPFSAHIAQDKDTVRTIDNIACELVDKNIQLYRITVHGKSFLHHMIRRIIGGACAVGAKKMDIDYITHVRDAVVINNSIPIAPASGLYLHHVRYV
jgi:tRNA pseudouridine38-40 synthase